MNREFDYNNNNIFLHLYSAFLGTQSNLHRRGGSPQPPPVCSIHLDDAMEAILHQNAHHTPAYWWRGDRLMQPISVWGLLGGHDGQRPMGIFGQDAWVTPLLFFYIRTYIWFNSSSHVLTNAIVSFNYNMISKIFF